ncbi:hypothetical protein TNCV_229071 [Trichonephila clavipes]|nr:hypothetical protein TNCV_229071 [Trichonephila clavipes]
MSGHGHKFVAGVVELWARVLVPLNVLHVKELILVKSVEAQNPSIRSLEMEVPSLVPSPSLEHDIQN